MRRFKAFLFLTPGFQPDGASAVCVPHDGTIIALYTANREGVDMEKGVILERARLPVSGEKDAVFPVMSRESIDSFRSCLERQGKKKETIQAYRRCAEHLFAFLPDDKEIRSDTLMQWRDAMFAESLSASSVHVHIAAANAYLEFLGHEEFQLAEKIPRTSGKKEASGLTWPEYLRLLQTAQASNDKRAYLLIKLFCNTGIRLCELSEVTAEAVNAGEIVIRSGNRWKRLPLPSGLRMELRDYAVSRGITSGSLFVRQNGTPLEHSEILPMVVKLFKKAGVLREKATTKVLRQFHRATCERIYSEIAERMEITFENPPETLRWI